MPKMTKFGEIFKCDNLGIFKQCGLDRNEFLLSLGVVTNNASVETSVVIEEEFAIALPSPNLFWAIANVGGSQSFLF